MLFKANHQNENGFFTVDDDTACDGASALMLISEASIKSAVTSFNTGKSAPSSGAASVSGEYPEGASLLSVVKSSEAAINSLLKAEPHYD